MQAFDPFDIWATERLGSLKARWYEGQRAALVPLGLVYVCDLLAPLTLRRFLNVPKSEFAHVLAILQKTPYAVPDTQFVDRMEQLRLRGGWGLGFKWFSANGTYADDLPYITNAPYVMQALLDVADHSPAKAKARALFEDSWSFLQSLEIMNEDDDTLALSYAPVKEPLIVVNSNSYAAYAYAMHARHGRAEIRAEARARAIKLVHWVIKQQYSDGRWYYLAERGPMDMIDGFHSCFVVRNIRYTRALLPELSDATEVDQAIALGWDYIKRELFDPATNLAKRYSVVSRYDPFRYDLYDQAEYLGLLIDFDEIEEAKQFVEVVKKRFCRDDAWFCRIDRLNRRWGRDFLRWGIAQFWVHEARLKKITSGLG